MGKGGKGGEKSAAATTTTTKDARAKELGISVKKAESFSKWYQEITVRAELIDYYDVSGCYILRPWSYRVWEEIQQWLNQGIRASGVQNAYFPLLIPKSALEREKDHVEGFAPEVAWVTKAGNSDMADPVAIRPTSETVMYPAYAKWIRSYRDLPLRLNQWCNIVRWEFKHAVPFIRSREFLWQEGHSAFASQAEADAEVLEMLDLYARAYEEVLAVPVVRGRKSEKEKFAGALYTTSLEAYIPHSGRGIQAATSHCLGQNFAKMFNISFESETAGADRALVWQNSWGFTTRSIGIMLMVHGDDSGAVMPPRVAPVQVVLVPIWFKDSQETVSAKAKALAEELTKAGIRVHLDDRDGYKPGFKYNHWEVRGVPLRLELGPKDLEKNQCVLARRVKVEGKDAKLTVSLDGLAATVQSLLDEVQADLLEKARSVQAENTARIHQWDQFVPALNQGKVVLAPWCDEVECEEGIKRRSGAEAKELAQDDESLQLSAAAKTLTLPFAEPKPADGVVCFACGKPAKVTAYLGRSY